MKSQARIQCGGPSRFVKVPNRVNADRPPRETGGGKDQMSRLLRSCLVGLLALALSIGGCATNRPVANDSLVVDYYLDRAKGARYFGKERGLPVTKWVCEHMATDTGLETLGAVLLIALPVVITEATIGGVADLLRGTDIRMKVEGYSAPVQRLRWGNNKVRVPKKLAGTRIRIWLFFEGNYEGTLSDEIDLTHR